MFKTRLLSGILLVIIALITVITGGSLLFGVLLLISLIGMTELYKVFGIEKKAPGVLGYIFAVGYYALLYFKPQLPGESLNWFMMLFMGYLICQMAVLVFAYPKYNTQQILAGFFGVFYVAVMLSYIYQTRILPGGIFTVWLVFVCSWGCDTCAYCVGMLIGKHKMAPILSPKKVGRRWNWRHRRSSTDRDSLCTCSELLGKCGRRCTQICDHRSSRRSDFPDWRPGSISDQAIP